MKKTGRILLTIALCVLTALLFVQTAAAQTKTYIGINAAKEIVFEDAELKPEEVKITKSRLVFSKNGRAYDVEFLGNGNEYEYLIDAYTGEIKEMSCELVKAKKQNTSLKLIGSAKAKSLALEDAELKRAAFTKAKLTIDDGIRFYELKFKLDSLIYEYDIDAYDGSIISKSFEPMKTVVKTLKTPIKPDVQAITEASIEAAKDVALKDAGVTSATFTKAELDIDDGVKHYDIEFYTDDNEYDYEINAVTGAIIEKSVEKRNKSVITVPETPETLISVADAKNAALADAGISIATFTKAELDIDDGVKHYDIEFYTDDNEYDYEINAVTGAIIEKSVEKRGKPVITVPETPETLISVADAKNAALADAGISAATFTKAELDIDDGVKHYDIEFYTDEYEYDYEINAVTGAIIEKSREKNDDFIAPTTPSVPAGNITVDEAKQIALSHAGLTAGEVIFSKAKLEDDDGKKVYEIEFYYGNVEYEYDIDASTGAILEWDRDIDD